MIDAVAALPKQQFFPPIEDVRKACAELRQSERLCGCSYSPTGVPCRAAIAQAKAKATAA